MQMNCQLDQCNSHKQGSAITQADKSPSTTSHNCCVIGKSWLVVGNWQVTRLGGEDRGGGCVCVCVCQNDLFSQTVVSTV